MATNRICCILAGGSGERFWPLSRRRRPKQLLRLTDPQRSLMEEAVDRVRPLFDAESIYIATSGALAEPIREAGCVEASRILCEPAKRNTLGAHVWIAANLLARGLENATLAVLTSDHKFGDEDGFRNMVRTAMDVAEESDGLVTCGIRPTRPETGYGYIEFTEGADAGAMVVAAFHEKPAPATTAEYLASGRFLWNSGMFFWTLPAFLSELEAAEPAAFAAIHEIASAIRIQDQARAEQVFDAVQNTSIDYALMERAQNVRVVVGKFGWDDVGAWDALPRTMPVDSNGLVQVGDVVAVDSRRSVVYNESTRQVLTCAGIDGLVVVATDDAVLVCPIDQAQRVKEIVAELSKNHPERL